MAELNQFALYSMNQSSSGLLTDITETVHKKLEDLSEYNKVKEYINEKFGDFNKPDDTVGYKFEKLNKSIMCKMVEQSTIMVLCRNNRTENIDWVFVRTAEK